MDAQTVQSGTAEKVGLFIQSVSYFVAAFIVGFVLNAKLTGILVAAVIPSMGLVIILGTKMLNIYSKKASESTTSANAIAEGAIKAVQVVQAFDAFEPLTADYRNHLKEAMDFGVKKALSSAVLLGSVFFVACVPVSMTSLLPLTHASDSPQMPSHFTKVPRSSVLNLLLEMQELCTQSYS